MQAISGNVSIYLIFLNITHSQGHIQGRPKEPITLPIHHMYMYIYIS